MLMPKKVKRRKQFTGRMTGQASRGTEVNYGDYGLQALECGWLSARQIEAARRLALQGAQNGALYVGALSFFGATLGTFQKFPNYDYYIEPAFVPTTDYNGSLSLLTSDPSAPGRWLYGGWR